MYRLLIILVTKTTDDALFFKDNDLNTTGFLLLLLLTLLGKYSDIEAKLRKWSVISQNICNPGICKSGVEGAHDFSLAKSAIHHPVQEQELMSCGKGYYGVHGVTTAEVMGKSVLCNGLHSGRIPTCKLYCLQ